jgi:hypothetical protein
LIPTLAGEELAMLRKFFRRWLLENRRLVPQYSVVIRILPIPRPQMDMHVLRNAQLRGWHEDPIMLRQVAASRLAPEFAKNALYLFLIINSRVEKRIALDRTQIAQPAYVTLGNHERMSRHQSRIAQYYNNVFSRIVDDPISFRVEITKRTILLWHFLPLSYGKFYYGNNSNKKPRRQ